MSRQAASSGVVVDVPRDPVTAEQVPALPAWLKVVVAAQPLADGMMRLADATHVARVAHLAIDVERQLRQTVTWQRSVLARTCGLAGDHELRELREQLAALSGEPREPQKQVPTRRRAKIHWREGGEGPTVLLLNGWSASGLVWPGVFVKELEQSFRVIRPDNRGTGWSASAPVPFTIRDLAHDAADVLKDARSGPAIVLGLSMGGMIAQELALVRPDLVRHLIVVSSSPPPPAAVRGDSGRLLSGLEPIRAGGARNHLKRLWGGYAGPGFADREPAMIAEVAAQVLSRPSTRGAMLHQLRATSAWYGSGRLKKIAVPTTIVHGDCDPLVPVANGMRLARLIPGAEYVELEGVGHLPPVESPARLCQVVRDAHERALASEGNDPR